MTARDADATPETAELLRLAGQLREAAARAGRSDVVARTDDLVLFIAGETAAPGDDEQRSAGKSDIVLRILNGLGF